jgi:hypothetical protein
LYVSAKGNRQGKIKKELQEIQGEGRLVSAELKGEPWLELNRSQKYA